MSCCCPPKADSEIVADSPVKKLLHNRHCTDVCCLLLYLLSLGGAALVAFAAFQVGDPGLLTHGKDYAGYLCGVDAEVATLPKVYYPRLAKDLRAYQQSSGHVEGTRSYMIPIYAVCVAECPESGGTVEDVWCTARSRHPGCRWARNPLASENEFGTWKVGVGTKDVVNRCLPHIQAEASETTLCALPDCTAAGKTCYTETFAEAKYWSMATAADRANCLRSVRLEVSRTFASPDSGLVDTFIGESVGGIFGAASDLSRAGAEVLAFTED